MPDYSPSASPVPSAPRASTASNDSSTSAASALTASRRRSRSRYVELRPSDFAKPGGAAELCAEDIDTGLGPHAAIDVECSTSSFASLAAALCCEEKKFTLKRAPDEAMVLRDRRYAQSVEKVVRKAERRPEEAWMDGSDVSSSRRSSAASVSSAAGHGEEDGGGAGDEDLVQKPPVAMVPLRAKGGVEERAGNVGEGRKENLNGNRKKSERRSRKLERAVERTRKAEAAEEARRLDRLAAMSAPVPVHVVAAPAPPSPPPAAVVHAAAEVRVPNLNDIDDWSDATSTVGTESGIEEFGLPRESVVGSVSAFADSWAESDSFVVIGEEAGDDSAEDEDREVPSVVDVQPLEEEEDSDDDDRVVLFAPDFCHAEEAVAVLSSTTLGLEEKEEDLAMARLLESGGDDGFVDEDADAERLRQRLGRVSGRLSLVDNSDDANGDENDDKSSQNSSTANWRFQDAEEESLPSLPMTSLPMPSMSPISTARRTPPSRRMSASLSPRSRQSIRRSTGQRHSTGDQLSCFPTRQSGGPKAWTDFKEYDEDGCDSAASLSASVALSDDPYDTFVRTKKEWRPKRNSYLNRLVTGHVVERPASSAASSPTPSPPNSW